MENKDNSADKNMKKTDSANLQLTKSWKTDFTDAAKKLHSYGS